MTRPTSVKPDNFFLLLFHALRQRRVPIALRIAIHSLLLVAAALVIYAWVMGMQFKQAMQQQADALGQSLTTQTAQSATELLVSNDILSLNVLLNNLTKNPLVAHAAIYSVDNRILAESGTRPKQGLLGDAEGLYSTPITFQEVITGHLRISLDMHQFEQPMTVSLQSMGLISLILLLLTLTFGLRLGRQISTPLLQLRVWLRDPDDPAPGAGLQNEIGDLARQLQARLVPENRQLPNRWPALPRRARKCLPRSASPRPKSRRWKQRAPQTNTSSTKTFSPTTSCSPPPRAARPMLTTTSPRKSSRPWRKRKPRTKSASRKKSLKPSRSRFPPAPALCWPCNWAPRNSCAACRVHAWWTCWNATATAWSKPRACTRVRSTPSATAAA